jgi:hypothetical protein
MSLSQPLQHPDQQKRISFSELKIWNECPFKHKLIYKDKIKNFVGNEYTAFGTAIHHVCENIVLDRSLEKKKLFLDKFEEEIKTISQSYEMKQKLLEDMKSQADDLVDYILPELDRVFPEFEVLAVEEPIYENITEFETDLKFKGFIDLILKTPDGKIHIIDWKTCSWGWDAQRKSEKMTVYQLSFYKNFYGKKYNIEEDSIETYFALLKRTAKKNKAEIFKVSNGKKRISNALNLLNRATTNIEKNLHIKNKLSCRRCEFYKTTHCP